MTAPAALMRMVWAALLLVALAVPVPAQSEDPDWMALRDRAKTALDSGAVSIDGLSALREDLVGWRAQFADGLNQDSGRVDTLRSQIDALGPPPAEGAEEPAEVAQERAALTARLDEALAPARVVQAAFAEADGLVTETDRQIEALRSERVFSKGPLPINPVNWPPAIASLSAWAVAFGTELWEPFATPTARAVWMADGVELGLLVFAAVLLLWRSGVWLGRLRDRIAAREADSAPVRVTLMGISLARLILPVLGLFSVARILQLMGAEGVRVEAAVTLLPLMGFIILMARWLSLQALPKRETAQAFLPFSPTRRPEARWHAVTLGVLMALAFALEVILPIADAPEQTRTISTFVVLALAGLNLLRLGQQFVAEGRAAQSDETEGFWPQVLRLMGRALMVVAVIAPLLAASGYANLGNALLWPAVLSLALVMLIGVLQELIFDLYATLTRRADAGRDALMPTLVGFALALASLPLLALIWGVRPTTLGEWWTTFMRGFSIGGTEISPSNFLTFAIVFVLGYMAVRLLKGVLRTNILPKTNMDSGGTNAVLSGTGYVGITLAALIAITAAGIDLSGLAIVAGALSVGIGFGLQTIVQNFVSGVILLVERPIKLGDWVNVGGVEGFVREISVRSTRIETFDRQDVIVPNADLISGIVTNYTLGNSAGRVVITVGVAYGNDTRRVQSILQEVAEAHPMVILQPPPLVTFDGFGADSLDFTVRVVIRDILFKVIVGSEINHAIAERFAAEGLEIPFAQRDIWLRNPETLRAAAPAPDQPPESP